MENLVWIIVGVIGLIASIATKAGQRQAGRSQQAPPKWPGPVAGPRPGQGPTWAPSPGPRPMPAPGPRPQAAPPAARQPAPAQREQPRTLVSGDVFKRSLEMEGYGEEGPGIGEGVDEEMSRFSRETEQMERRNLSELTDDLVRPEENAYSLTRGEQGPTDLQAALADPAGLPRAILLAEVLGKPKALRGRGFGRA